MQAYATAERPATGQRLVALDPIPPASRRQDFSGGESETALLDLVFGRLADLVADRVLARIAATEDTHAGEWMNAHDAAAYLGIHRDTLRKLAAQRSIPVHQDGPRAASSTSAENELDDWRRSAQATHATAASLRAAS
jgi:excisionase family DNA binding protein